MLKKIGIPFKLLRATKVLVGSTLDKIKHPWIIGCRWNFMMNVMTNIEMKYVYHEKKKYDCGRSLEVR